MADDDRIVEPESLQSEAEALARILAHPDRVAERIGKRTMTTTDELASFAVAVRHGLGARA